MNFTTIEGISYIPQQATGGAAGYDLRAAERKRLVRNNVILVPTGICVEVPNGHVLFIFSRSGFGKRGIILANGVGVVDPRGKK